MSKKADITVTMKSTAENGLPAEGYCRALSNRDYQIWITEAVRARISSRSPKHIDLDNGKGVTIIDEGGSFQINGANLENSDDVVEMAAMMIAVKGWINVEIRAPGLAQEAKTYLGKLVMQAGILMNDGRMPADRRLLENFGNWRLPHWMRGDITDKHRETWLANADTAIKMTMHSLREASARFNPTAVQ